MLYQPEVMKHYLKKEISCSDFFSAADELSEMVCEAYLLELRHEHSQRQRNRSVYGISIFRYPDLFMFPERSLNHAPDTEEGKLRDAGTYMGPASGKRVSEDDPGAIYDPKQQAYVKTVLRKGTVGAACRYCEIENGFGADHLPGACLAKAQGGSCPFYNYYAPHLKSSWEDKRARFRCHIPKQAARQLQNT